MSTGNPWKIPSKSEQKKAVKNNKGKTSKEQSAIKRLEDEHKKNIEKAKTYMECIDSSSEEEVESNHGEILEKLFRGYCGEGNQLSKTQDFLENFLQSGSVICLICIGTVKRNDSIWSCTKCFCFFHLVCIKRWGNDSISQQKLRQNDDTGYYNNLGEYIPRKIKPIRWCCPKCRSEYDAEDIPRVYNCFCGKEINPSPHSWLIPHSCGEICEKYLVPDCGHKCLLLCHPGPCPPCPQNIFTSCKCRQSKKRIIRCFQKSWTCDVKCSSYLSCGIHKCGQLCHEPEKCPPCTKKSKQKCQCGSEITERNCSELFWQCNKVCNKELSCGIHTCKEICHGGDCGDCPLGQPRSCPCGKKNTLAPCSEVIDTCGDTCQKLLPCGIHHCAQRCHKGECSPCLTLTEKKCRCGNHMKEQPCSRIFTCETKCKQIRDCGKHTCNKKCCDGKCPPCDKICSKTLSCKKHKCKSVCHDGPCYPCDLKSLVKCRCGYTSITVPCGREKKTRPPKCSQPCKIPSKCHHQNPHNCHMNECPPCTQKCNLENDVSNCIHLCEARCHDAVKVPIDTKNQNATIWHWNYEKYEIKRLPHPRCEVKVMVTCIGGHETALWPCWNSQASSCQRVCGRVLKCGNHTCQRICHTVVDLNEKNEQEGCNSCEKGCNYPRNNGCIHPCRRPCHILPCEPCSIMIKSNCHCGLTQVYYKCSEYYRSDLDKDTLKETREKLKSCGNRCIKNYPCGHRCTSVCHSDDCPEPGKCKKKIKIYCNCKSLKTEVTCEKYKSGFSNIPCDSNCAQKKKAEIRAKQEEEEKQRKIEEEKNRLELEQFEKKFGKKKHRERKIREDIPKQNNYKMLICGLFVGALSLVLGIYLLR